MYFSAWACAVLATLSPRYAIHTPVCLGMSCPLPSVGQAIQLAYYRLHHEVTATYETGHTRLFYHGRTETIKATTSDSVAFTKAMDDPTVDVSVPLLLSPHTHTHIEWHSSITRCLARFVRCGWRGLGACLVVRSCPVHPWTLVRVVSHTLTFVTVQDTLCTAEGRHRHPQHLCQGRVGGQGC